MIASTNQAWGFFGTCVLNYQLTDEQAAELFNLVGQHLVAAQIARDGEAARQALDSRHGRHFANDMSVKGGAVAGMTPHELGNAAVITLSANPHWIGTLRAEARATTNPH